MLVDVLTLVAPTPQFMATSYLAPLVPGATNPNITWLGPMNDDGTQDLVYIKGLTGEPWDYMVATQSWIRQRLTERVWSNPATGKLTYGLGVRRLPRWVIYTPGCQFSFSWTMQSPETDYVIYDPPLAGSSQPALSHNTDAGVRCTFRGPYPGAAISNSQGNVLLPAGEDWVEDYEWAGKGNPVIYGSLERVTHRKGFGRYMWQLFPSDGHGGYAATPSAQSQQCVITPLPNGVVVPRQGIF